jgi:hypothetical protein
MPKIKICFTVNFNANWYYKGCGFVGVVGEQIYDRAIVLYGQTKRDGSIDEVKTAEYKGKCIPLLNQVLQDIVFIEGKNETDEIHNISDYVAISDNSAMRVAPFGLAMLFALSDGDNALLDFFSKKYEFGKSTIRKASYQMNDVYDILSGMR